MAGLGPHVPGVAPLTGLAYPGGESALGLPAPVGSCPGRRGLRAGEGRGSDWPGRSGSGRGAGQVRAGGRAVSPGRASQRRAMSAARAEGSAGRAVAGPRRRRLPGRGGSGLGCAELREPGRRGAQAEGQLLREREVSGQRASLGPATGRQNDPDRERGSPRVPGNDDCPPPPQARKQQRPEPMVGRLCAAGPTPANGRRTGRGRGSCCSCVPGLKG